MWLEAFSACDTRTCILLSYCLSLVLCRVYGWRWCCVSPPTCEHGAENRPLRHAVHGHDRVVRRRPPVRVLEQDEVQSSREDQGGSDRGDVQAAHRRRTQRASYHSHATSSPPATHSPRSTRGLHMVDKVLHLCWPVRAYLDMDEPRVEAAPVPLHHHMRSLEDLLHQHHRVLHQRHTRWQHVSERNRAQARFWLGGGPDLHWRLIFPDALAVTQPHHDGAQQLQVEVVQVQRLPQPKPAQSDQVD